MCASQASRVKTPIRTGRLRHLPIARTSAVHEQGGFVDTRQAVSQSVGYLFGRSDGTAWICVDLRGSAWICVDLRGSAWICVDLRGSAWICVDLRGSAWICVSTRLMKTNLGGELPQRQESLSDRDRGQAGAAPIGI
jgi:hypothetical protein